ncbi:GPW/gp25 family protein [Aquabacterium parvum]|jgi:phage baseplate assembly protein W|uniref:GPW/gp25 family protein n=1 Tax=Aquabacterium parvum TaxID=70584 RepID=UPI000718F2B8|nr:GPW/gp25 family protein [Aquabacterium parvum]MBU0917475.1 GPW/gp25 family protein [Gammaproteobacteria bacterium]
MDNRRIFGQGMAFPPRVGPDGRMAWSVGETNVHESIRIILSTEPGERLRLPAFGAGLRRFLFEPNTLATHTLIKQAIGEALKRWEPRIQLESVEVAADSHDTESAIATLTYRLVATQVQERLSVAVSVQG